MEHVKGKPETWRGEELALLERKMQALQEEAEDARKRASEAIEAAQEVPRKKLDLEDLGL